MNKILLFTLLFVGVVSTSKAQIYTPGGTIQGGSGNNNVGIGTGSPSSLLTLRSTGNDAVITLNRQGLWGSVASGLKLTTDDAGTDYWNFGMLSNGTNTLHLGRNGGSNVSFLTNGNVGIGTTNPEAKLDVNGAIQSYGGANQFYGFGPASASKSIDVRSGSHYPYVFNWHEGLTFSAHSAYGGIRFYNQGYPDMYGTGVLVMSITNNNVGIGTTNPTSKLTVAGDIHSREVKVTVNAGADFVFEKEYNLPTLDSVNKYIKENKHLPEIASAAEMQKDGINLSEMNIKLLQKVEELTLYMIDMKKENEKMKKDILKLQNQK